MQQLRREKRRENSSADNARQAKVATVRGEARKRDERLALDHAVRQGSEVDLLLNKGPNVIDTPGNPP